MRIDGGTGATPFPTQGLRSMPWSCHEQRRQCVHACARRAVWPRRWEGTMCQAVSTARKFQRARNVRVHLQDTEATKTRSNASRTTGVRLRIAQHQHRISWHACQISRAAWAATPRLCHQPVLPVTPVAHAMAAVVADWCFRIIPVRPTLRHLPSLGSVPCSALHCLPHVRGPLLGPRCGSAAGVVPANCIVSWPPAMVDRVCVRLATRARCVCVSE